MRVERLRATFEIEIVLKHFPLHPDTPLEGLTLEELFSSRNFDLSTAEARMSSLMTQEGLPYGNRTMTYNSGLAQELGKWAEAQPSGHQIHDALFKAYFVDNLNLASIENLVRVATDVGLPPVDARTVLEKRSFRAEVDADWRRSRELGITGVPTFVIGNRGLVGAQPYDRLESFVSASGTVRRA